MEKSPFEQFEELRIDNASRLFLTETARWATFLAILGYIGIGLMLLVAIFVLIIGSSVSMGPFSGGTLISLFYFALAAFYYLPINFLYRFSSNMKEALRTNNQTNLTKSFEYLKSHYKFIGILTIVLFGLYILMIIGTIITGFGSYL